MAEKKRQCGTCRFFVESETRGHGKCTHPKRDTALREMVLLRPNELGCRTRWGTSLWQDPADESDPTAPDTPQQPALPEPISAHMHYDDEVTSVSIAGSTSTRPSFDDDVVDSGAVASGMGPWNDTLQEERRRLLIHGERDALAGARKRHMEKQSRKRELVPFADDAAAEAPKNESPEEPVEQPQEAMATSKPNFPPDDYVEEERSSDTDAPVDDDAIVDEGIRPGSNRSPRSRRLMRETKSPKDHKAMGLGLPAEMAVTSHNPEKREQWNSVPAMTPGFELPLVNAPESRPSTPLRISASAAPVMSTSVPSRPVSQARELLSEDRLRHERARRHVDVPLANENRPHRQLETPTPAVAQRPRLSHAPAAQAAPVDRLKSSPLRGTHPAVKAAAARTQEQQARPQQPARQGNVPANVQADQPLRQGSRAPQQASVPEMAPMQEGMDHAPERSTEAPVRREQVRTEQPRRRPPVPAQPAHEMSPFTRRPIAIAPDVPRMCGNCTNFRPSGVEGRGSCTNAFAGPVQRVVHAEDVACQHTYGSFWIPADNKVGLEEPEKHVNETPRVDRMIARRTQRTNPVLPDLEELTS